MSDHDHADETQTPETDEAQVAVAEEPIVEATADAMPGVDSDEPQVEVRLRTLNQVVEELRGTGRTPEQMLEALLFSTHSPLSKDEIGQALGMDAQAVESTVFKLREVLAQRGAPVDVFLRSKDDGSAKKLAGSVGYILDVKASYRQTMVTVGRPVLSQSLTETLALIALNQPIGQSRLVRERGSTVYEHVKDLLRRGWIQRIKKGRSYDLRTTETFAAEFGLDDDVDLIKRALARTAGVHGQADLVGSQRVHFDAGSDGEIDLAAEARDCVVSGGEAPLPLPRFGAGADCLVSGGGVDDEPAAAREDVPSEARPRFNVVAELAAEALLESAAFARQALEEAQATDSPPKIHTSKADCVLDLEPIDLGETPSREEPTVAANEPTPGEDSDQPDLSKTETNKRLKNLFSTIDDESTDDDW